MGDEGTLVISEDERKGFFTREVQAKRREWEDEAAKIEKMGMKAIQLKIGETLKAKKDPKAQKLIAEAKKHPLLLHLENFFGAIRGAGKLTCPAEVAYESTVTVLKVNEAVGAKRRLEFKPEEFTV